jgi:hypothetical protein
MGLLIENSQPVIRLPGRKDAACWRKIYLQRMELLNKIRAAHLRSKLATLQYLPSGGHHAIVSKAHHCQHRRPFSISGSFGLHIVAGYKSHPSSILFAIDISLICVWCAVVSIGGMILMKKRMSSPLEAGVCWMMIAPVETQTTEL